MPPLPEGTALTVGTHQVTVQKFLLAGGFSQIYRVAMDPPEYGSAVGCLKQVIVNDKTGLATLRKEVDVMKTLRDARCVVRYFDSNAERLADGTYQVLVLMELCPNKSLLEYMNARIRTKLGEGEILDIMRDICVALYEMHRRQLVHRDIKIENVLIGQTAGGGHEAQLGQFKLADFGLVARPTPVPSDPLLLLQLGHDLLYQTTPQYRAPEMVDLYRGIAIDQRADMWALGCFLYKLCYYTTPFEAQGDVAILHGAYGFPPAPPYSGDLKNLIVIMLQENASYRPNIVQLLMLLARMRGEDFALLKIEDFYGAGEYNFHALHEMQRRAQRAHHAAQVHANGGRVERLETGPDSRSERRSKSETRSTSTPTPDPAPRIPADQVHKPLQVHTETKTSVGESPEGITTGNNGLSPQTIPMNPLALIADQSNLTEGVVDSDGSEVDLDLGELALEDAEVRYPSLDELDLPVTLSTTFEKAKSYESVKSLNDRLDVAIKMQSPDNLAKSESEKSVQSEHPDKSEQSGNPERIKEGKPSVYENAEAWQKLTGSSLDKDAERLAEAIFVSRSVSGKSRSLERVAVADSPVTPVFLDEARRLRRRDRIAIDSLSTDHTELEQLGVPEKEREEASSRDPLREVHGESLRELPRELQLETNRGFTREVGEMSQPQLELLPREHVVSIQTPIEKMQAESAPVSLPHELTQPFSPSLAPIGKRESSNPWGNVLASEAELKSCLSAPALNLIDLDGSQASTRGTLQHSPLVGAVPQYEEVSLLDLDLDASRDVGTKPVFKKKRDILSQPLAFQEEVIDFASDDENTNSEMSRVAIRDSLRRPKGRKSVDHRRSDSTHAKRRLFFGE